MATVKFRKELQNNIISIARNIFLVKKDRLNLAVKNEWFDTIYNRAYAQYMPHMNALPNEFFDMRSEILVTKFGTSDVSLRFKLARDYKFPRQNPQNLLISQNSWRSELSITDDNQWGDVASEIYGHIAKVRQIDNECEDFVKAVEKIINTYPTLAPALKAWPPLWDLLPEATQARHKLVTERVKNEVVMDMDLTKLTTIVVMHKLTK
jgi:hypothetical protein